MGYNFQVAVAEQAGRVYALVRRIPPGKVVSYGQLAALCPPLTPRHVGQLMARALASELPWWRVVGSDGRLRTLRRDPMLAQLQRTLLLREGVQFTPDGRVAMTPEQVANLATFEVELP